MKILMISSYLPYPLHSGGQVRLYNLIKELSDKHEITLICEKRPHQTEDDVAAVAKICKNIITVPRRKQWSLSNIAKSATSSSSFLVTGHTSSQMQEKIEVLLRSEKFDLIHVETFYVLQNLVACATYQASPLPTVLVEHNIEYQVYKRFMNRAPRPVRSLLAIDIAKIQKEEEAAWRQATKVVAVSTRDKDVIEQTGLKPALVANGVNLDQFSFQDSTSSSTGEFRDIRKVLFIGDFAWLQNRDSVEFIIQEIWPLIRAKSKEQRAKSELKLWIVARRIPESIRSLTDDPDVIFDEESSAKKTPEIFHEAEVLLAPIRVGGGTSYKILESMSCGTPVVTMPMSANAIAATDGEHLMAGRVPQELADKTLELLQSKKLYERIAKSGRKLIEEKYSWKKIAKDLDDVYKGVVS